MNTFEKLMVLGVVCVSGQLFIMIAKLYGMSH